MDLFPPEPRVSLLPFDGEVNDHGRVMSLDEADRYFSVLDQTTPWRQDEVILFGKHITTARRMAWYGDSQSAYTYSGITRFPLPWTPELRALKALVEQICGTAFNSCLLNAYADGSQGMGWHSDDEKSLGRDPMIASLSFGAARRFCFKHRVQAEKREIELGHGTLLVMKGPTQHHWLHSLPKSAKVKESRINLTFRQVRAP